MNNLSKKQKNLLDRMSLITCQTNLAKYFINKNEIENADPFLDCIELNIKELKEIIKKQ